MIVPARFHKESRIVHVDYVHFLYPIVLARLHILDPSDNQSRCKNKCVRVHKNAVHDSFVTYLLNLDDVKLRERTKILDFFELSLFICQRFFSFINTTKIDFKSISAVLNTNSFFLQSIYGLTSLNS